MSESIESSSDEDTLSQEQSRCSAMCSTSRSSKSLPVSMAMLYAGKEGPSDHMDIETPPTSPETQPTSPECGHSDTNRTKATEWIRQVSIEVRNQFDQSYISEPMKTPVDSGKRGRGKHFVGGGLAEKMQRIIQRENSDITFWEHHSTTRQETDIVGCCGQLCVKSHIYVALKRIKCPSLLLLHSSYSSVWSLSLCYNLYYRRSGNFRR